MTNLEVRFIQFINELFPITPNLREVASAKYSVRDYQNWEKAEIERLLPEFGAAWDISGKDLLDIGCGLGGKTVHYAVDGRSLRYRCRSAFS